MAIEKCVMCGCDNVAKADLEVPLKSSTGITSITVTGQKCTSCGEEYINGKELRVIELIEKTLNELAVGA